MVTTAQFTASRTIVMKDGYVLPTTANQRTDLNDLPICEMIYARRNEGRVCRATLTAVFDAMRDSSAVVVLYIGADGKQDARALWPESITLTSEQNIVTRVLHDASRDEDLPPGPHADLPRTHDAGGLRAGGAGMSEDRGWELLTELLDALARHFTSLRIIDRDRELHAAYVAYLRFIDARDAENE